MLLFHDYWLLLVLQAVDPGDMQPTNSQRQGRPVRTAGVERHRDKPHNRLVDGLSTTVSSYLLVVPDTR